MPYSLSRWTDLPAAKWEWFLAQLDQGWMWGFDPRTAVPSKWSLKPEDTQGLIFWTKDPANLVDNTKLLEPYPLVVHMTLTGWEEVERGAPNLMDGMALLCDVVNAFGPDRVVWRFSPVPTVPDVVERFETIAKLAAHLGLGEVFLAFLQENDRLPETRSRRIRVEVLRQLAAHAHGLRVRLCNEDRTLSLSEGPLAGIKRRIPDNLGTGICEAGARFKGQGPMTPTEGCGCALAIDPFTFNESCSMGCNYCYAADETLSPHKRNTTKLRVIR